MKTKTTKISYFFVLFINPFDALHMVHAATSNRLQHRRTISSCETIKLAELKGGSRVTVNFLFNLFARLIHFSEPSNDTGEPIKLGGNINI